jgi:hypothetical protein
MSATTTSLGRHRTDGTAIARCRVAHRAGVVLPSPCARRVAATAPNDVDHGVSRPGNGVVIRSVSATEERVPVPGYAESRGRWPRDGSRDFETPVAEEPVEAVGIGL